MTTIATPPSRNEVSSAKDAKVSLQEARQQIEHEEREEYTKLAANTSIAMIGGAAGFLAFGPVGAVSGIALGATGGWAALHFLGHKKED
ncbi:MAG: hypothetical protein KGQ26_03500 [Rhodospirillales bacterium]|nr:hypothetical protein [Rhodospirillales bacterium]